MYIYYRLGTIYCTHTVEREVIIDMIISKRYYVEDNIKMIISGISTLQSEVLTPE